MIKKNFRDVNFKMKLKFWIMKNANFGRKFYWSQKYSLLNIKIFTKVTLVKYFIDTMINICNSKLDTNVLARNN